MRTPIRVLVVDDSPICSEGIAQSLQEEGDIVVVGRGWDGREAIDLAKRLRPDLITMDVCMPVLTGLEALEQIMAECPTRVLVVTSEPRGAGGELVFEAIARGALDLMPKTELSSPADRAKLRQKVRLLARVPVVGRPKRHTTRSEPMPAVRADSVSGVIGIVSSTGGPGALEIVLGGLPRGFSAAIAIVQHLPPGFAERMVEWLAKGCALEVAIAKPGTPLRPGLVSIAPGDCHLVVEANELRLDHSAPPVGGHRPSGSVLLESIGRSWGSRGAGVVLTGMGDDGAAGLVSLHRAGGRTFAQDAASCVVDGMPAAARASGEVDEIHPLPTVAAGLVKLERLWRTERTRSRM